MKNRYLALRVLAAAALICAVAGLSGSRVLAKTSGDLLTSVPQLELVRLVNNRPITALLMDDPEAIYEGARIVHNVTVDGEKGMRVHAKFRVKYGKGVACMLIAYFYYDD